VEDDGAWVASVPDLPGCASFGDTVTEAVDGVQKTKDLWIEGQYRIDANIPEPTDEEDFSGKFVLRIPKVLHRLLTYEAKKQGVSLNHYASHLLSQRQSLQAFETMAHSILNSVCSYSSRTPWVYGKHERGNSLVMGNLPGNVEFVAVLRKPPAECSYKASLPSALKKRYQIAR
jgi:predicted RNase H-like HicB family nuclease